MSATTAASSIGPAASLFQVRERPCEIDTLDLRPAGGGQRRDLDVDDVLHWGNPPVLRDSTGGRSLEGCDITSNPKPIAPHHQMPIASGARGRSKLRTHRRQGRSPGRAPKATARIALWPARAARAVSGRSEERR